MLNQSLETGNIIIDEQHKSLIAAINNLLDACEQGNSLVIGLSNI